MITDHFRGDVLQAIKDRDLAQRLFENAVGNAQRSCEHPEVLEAPWHKVCTDGAGFPAERVCRCCGLHEYGGYGSETTRGFGRWKTTVRVGDWHGDPKITRLGTEFAKACQPEEIHKYTIRVPDV